MIGYLRGKVLRLENDACLLDVNGVGYRLVVPGNLLSNLRQGQECAFYTHLQVREDALVLFGFAEAAEYELFLQLLGVSGVGPKAAVSILSTLRPTALRQAIVLRDWKTITQVPGIGKKTAERMLLELSDKMSLGEQEGVTGAALATVGNDTAPSALMEAGQALESLGYDWREIKPVLDRLPAEEQQVGNLVRLALKELSRRA